MIDQYLTQAQRNLDAGNLMDALREFGVVWLNMVSTIPQRRQALDGICATMTVQNRSTTEVESVRAFGRTHLQTLARNTEFEQPLVGGSIVSIEFPFMPPLRPSN